MKKLTSFSKEQELACIDESVTRPDYRELLRAVVDVVFSIQETGVVQESHLDAFHAAMACPNQEVWDRTGGWLRKVCDVDASVQEFILRLASDARAGTRFNTCATLSTRRFSRDLQVKAFKMLLRDRSSKVRDRAADGCQALQLREMASDIEQAISEPRNQRIRRSLQISLDLLVQGQHEEDGYVMERQDSDRYSVRRTKTE